MRSMVEGRYVLRDSPSTAFHAVPLPMRCTHGEDKMLSLPPT
jgi:hypothetical protein